VRRDIKVIRANLPLLMAYGAVGFACFNNLLYSALEHTTAINVAIEQAGMPMVIFLANFLLFRIRVTPAQIAGFVLTLAGVARHRLERQPGAPDRARAQPRRRADAARRALLWRLHRGAALQAGPALAIDDHGDGGLGLPHLAAVFAPTRWRAGP
jgi:hypothetical protein